MAECRHSQVLHLDKTQFSGVSHLDKTVLRHTGTTPGQDQTQFSGVQVRHTWRRLNDYSGRVYNTSPVNHVDSYHSNSFVNYKMTNLTTATTQICNNTTTVCVPDWTLIPLSWSNLTSSVVTCVHRSISLNVLVSRDCYE